MFNESILEPLEEIDMPYQEVPLSFENIRFPNEPVSTNNKPSTDWMAAKLLYIKDYRITYKDIANKFGVSLKQVKKHGARENWTIGRQRVSSLAEIKITEILSDEIVASNERYVATYRQLQSLAIAHINLMQNQTRDLKNKAKAVRGVPDKQPNPKMLLDLYRSLGVAISGERVALGLPINIVASAAWSPSEKHLFEPTVSLEEIQEIFAIFNAKTDPVKS